MTTILNTPLTSINISLLAHYVSLCYYLKDKIMTKEEAIQAMKSGAKVTHRFFMKEEWIVMEGNLTIVTEEGYSISTIEFWRDRKGENWNDCWSIWSSK